jgi:hypothetical protein
MSTPAMLSASAANEPGRRLGGRYLLLAPVGRGRSGSVWRAHDALLGRDVAVKRLHVGRGLDAWRSRMVRERARREGRVAARLHHPRLAAIYDITELDGEVCLVMEYVAGPSLADLLAREGPLPAARVAAIGAQIAEGLAAMHRCGIVHRDVKPANIMIGPSDTVTITDFGVAVACTDPGGGDHHVADIPHHMAPELARGDVPTAAADMFSLGATLHAALEGTPPGRDHGTDESLDMLARVTPDVVRPTGRVQRLRPVLRALLDHDPQRRPDAVTAARLLAEDIGTVDILSADGAVGASGTVEPSSVTPCSRPSVKLASQGAAGHNTSPIDQLTTLRALAPDRTEDRPPAAVPERRTAPGYVGGRHRAVLAAWWRPPRRAVAVGAGLAGVLAATGIVALATGADPPSPEASPSVRPVADPPLPVAGPPMPAAPGTATSTTVQEVASPAPPRSATSRRATARHGGSSPAGPAARLEAGGKRGGDQGGGRGGDQGGGSRHGNGNGHGRGHGD